MQNALHRFSQWWGRIFLGRIASPIAVGSFLAGTGLAITEVVRRYVFGTSWIWQGDLVVLFLVMGIFIFFSNAQWTRGHISVTLVHELILRKESPKRRRIVETFEAIGDLITGSFVLLLVVWGLPLTAEYRHGGIRLQSQAMEYWPFYLVMMLALMPFVVTSFLHAYEAFRGEVRGGTGESEMD